MLLGKIDLKAHIVLIFLFLVFMFLKGYLVNKSWTLIKFSSICVKACPQKNMYLCAKICQDSSFEIHRQFLVFTLKKHLMCQYFRVWLACIVLQQVHTWQFEYSVLIFGDVFLCLKGWDMFYRFMGVTPKEHVQVILTLVWDPPADTLHVKQRKFQKLKLYNFFAKFLCSQSQKTYLWHS